MDVKILNVHDTQPYATHTLHEHENISDIKW
jgi:hypothetical protein